MEKENQETYTAQALRDLKHKHAAATKQLPKNLKVGRFYVLSLCCHLFRIVDDALKPGGKAADATIMAAWFQHAVP